MQFLIYIAAREKKEKNEGRGKEGARDREKIFDNIYFSFTFLDN